MIRGAFPFCAVLAILFGVVAVRGGAHAQPAGSFDQQLATNVYSTALSFMVPRLVDAEPVSVLSFWGLQGITAIDPKLMVERPDSRLHLMARGKSVFDLAAPKDELVAAWVPATVALTKAALGESATLRRAGTGRIVQAFFDELFNHLDPYSRYVPPAEAGEDREERSGTAGIGIALEQRGSLVVVSDVIRDGPAAMSGVRPGDVVLAVDGRTVRGKDARAVAALIAGPEDTGFALTWRGRDGKSHEASFVRVLVPPETVFGERSADVLIVRITGFNNTTDTHLAHILQEGMAGDRPPDGIVLDLRGNRGGLLRQAVTVADTFLPEGLITSTAGRAADANHVWNSTPGELAEGVPLIVLVDGRTASAAEVLAAALADRGRAVVVGSSTYGKGVVQTIAPLPDGGELFVTWSRILAPRGWPIQGLGVMPQVCTSVAAAVVRRQLDYLADGEQPMMDVIAAHRSVRAPAAMARLQAIRDLCPATMGRESDLSVARILIENPAAYAAALLPPMR